jgi:dTDP-4-dehydrorhamnose reductase
MRILVLGMNGMLGRYVYSYFSGNYEVVGTTRRELDASTITSSILASNIRPDDVVINCIGLIKQRSEVDKFAFVTVNSFFPLLLHSVCEDNGVKLIHITTDCAFNGLKGGYDEDSVHDATDIYGKSKSLGEPEEATVIRTSIIGEELSGFLSLLEWVKSNKDKEVFGYTNHLWNGITCLEFAKICERIIEEDLFWTDVKHVFSPTSFNKHELVQMISDVYELNLVVVPHVTEVKCDRTLSSIRDDISIQVPELREQLVEMRNFYTKLMETKF